MSGAVAFDGGSDRAVNAIEQLIVSGGVVPGERLPNERELAVRLGVSRGSVREAIRTLCAQGVLESRVGSGTYVTSLHPKILLGASSFGISLLRARQVSELLEVRRALEGVVARAAAQRMTARDHVELHALIEIMGADVSLDERIAADVAFHRLIADRAGNDVISAFLEAFSVDTEAVRVSRGLLDDAALRVMREEHALIADALRDADEVAAGIAAERHVTNLIDWFERHQAAT